LRPGTAPGSGVARDSARPASAATARTHDAATGDPEAGPLEQTREAAPLEQTREAAPLEGAVDAVRALAATPGRDPVEGAVDAVRALAATPGPLLVVCDFDGTLAPISLDPTAPAILPAARRALRRLAAIARRRPGRLAVAILSGRTALDVAGRVRVGGLTYLGDHGIQGGYLPVGVAAERLEVTEDPRLAAHHAVARRLGDEVTRLLDSAAWLFVEPKGPSIAFHFRAAEDYEAARARIMAALDVASAGLSPALRGPRFRRLDGRRIVELRPEGAGAKGDAVARLLERHGSMAALVIGDDRSDAEAFAVVARELGAGRLAASLLLGVQGARETPAELLAAATLILPDPAASAVVLRELARALEAEDRAGR
jgi:trehalose 6-phosphate phosphatase